MNIFEQYGIKEVADVTLYAIELNKYDDEVYIPILYFDTLKVSTLEQTAEQTSARGGLGNPELITWDFGKEISVTLEDALYSPASQSLMWGGKFGTKNTKIFGVWNPFVYEKDENGRPIWVEKKVVIANKYKLADNGIYQPENGQNNLKFSEDGKSDGEGSFTEEQLKKDGWIKFICPCDNHVKYMKYVENINGHYKYYKTGENVDNKEDQMKGFILKCPKNLEIKENGEYLIGYAADEVFTLGNWENNERPEFAELTVKNFGDFGFEQFIYQPTVEDGKYFCKSTTGTVTEALEKCECSNSYVWLGTDLLMSSIEGDQDVYTINNAALRIRTNANDTDRQIMVANRSLYRTKYAKNNIIKDTALTYEDQDKWEIEKDKEGNAIPVQGMENMSDRYNTERLSYVYKYDTYSSKIDVYADIKWGTPSLTQGDELNHITRIKVGTFYIINDWNSYSSTPYENIYPINDGMEDVKVLDRMEKCKATRTFCINAQTNLASYNYSQLPQYARTSLTVYIDPRTMKPYEPNTDTFTRANGHVVKGDLRVIKQYETYYKWTRTVAPKYTSLGHSIIVDAIHYPGTYRLVGETYARSRDTGKDQRFQFEIPLAKMSAETNLTLQADGDPTTFTMNLKALRREDGVMVKLTQYNVEEENYDGYKSGSTAPVPQEGKHDDVWEDSITEYQSEIDLVEPYNETYFMDIINNDKIVAPKAVLNTTSKTTNVKFNFQTAEFSTDTVDNGAVRTRELKNNEYKIQIQEG